MDLSTKREPTNEMHKTNDTEAPLDLSSIKYDDKRLKDPLFCKRVAAALDKCLLDEEPPLEGKSE